MAPLVLMGGLYAGLALLPTTSRASEYVIRLKLDEPGQAIGLPPVEGPQGLDAPLVVIDPGHGGHDPGASGAGFTEKTLVLALATALRDQLLEQGAIRVAMTRSEDRFLALEERADIARRLGAQLFLSIHADSAGDAEAVSGATIYTLAARASDQAAARLAARENNADSINGVVLRQHGDAVSSILVDLAQRSANEAAAEFAGLVIREGEGTLSFHPNPRRSAAFAVLRAPDVPSVLFEAGYISNPDDAAWLASQEGSAAFAAVMARAIRVHFARRAAP